MLLLRLLKIYLPMATALSATTALAQEEVKFSARAFQCQAYEFAELDSMSRGELQGAYCSYSIGADRASKRNATVKEKYKEQPRILAGLLGDHVRFLEGCAQGLSKTQDLLSRKFAGPAPDCKPMAEKTASARSAGRVASP